MALIRVEEVHKNENGNQLLQKISFSISKGSKTAIAGLTGSGKTTLLKIMGGLLQASGGAVYFNEEKIKGPDEQLLPGHKAIAYLSQYFELRNHYRVKDLLSLNSRCTPEEEKELVSVCRVAPFLNRWTHQLSGGEKQRIALACLLLTKPSLLLLDEPFSNLDPIHKAALKEVLDDVGEMPSCTCILVSHDPADTLSWADEILVLKEGMLIQKGVPTRVFYRPADPYTAALFGPYNVLPTELRKLISDAGFEVPAQREFFRPNEFRPVPSSGLTGKVQQSFFMGTHYLVLISIGSSLLRVTLPRHLPAGQLVSLQPEFYH